MITLDMLSNYELNDYILVTNPDDALMLSIHQKDESELGIPMCLLANNMVYFGVNIDRKLKRLVYLTSNYDISIIKNKKLVKEKATVLDVCNNFKYKEVI